MDIITSFAGMLAALGGFKFVEWLFTRKSNGRIAEATAEAAELKNERDEFHFLRERLEYKDAAMMEKEKRFIEQTELVRSLNRQLLDQTIENGKLMAKIRELEVERRMKLCERKGCVNREPQSGY